MNTVLATCGILFCRVVLPVAMLVALGWLVRSWSRALFIGAAIVAGMLCICPAP